ncbi:hypothetical protein GCM10018779_06080 [Streptomyces griseocarneus]|nr:hypothetical protein GCM10018779_06080 [Streptomyces griseocarneus]
MVLQSVSTGRRPAGTDKDTWSRARWRRLFPRAEGAGERNRKCRASREGSGGGGHGR